MWVHTDLLVVEECVSVVNRATCTPTFPLSMEHGFVPGLLQTQQTGVDLERGVCESRRYVHFFVYVYLVYQS